MEELPVREAVSASRRRRGGGIWDSETNKSNVANLQLDRSLSQIDESLLVAEGSEVPAVAQFRRSYSSLLADEAGMPIDIMKAALEEADGMKQPSPKCCLQPSASGTHVANPPRTNSRGRTRTCWLTRLKCRLRS